MFNKYRNKFLAWIMAIAMILQVCPVTAFASTPYSPGMMMKAEVSEETEGKKEESSDKKEESSDKKKEDSDKKEEASEKKTESSDKKTEKTEDKTEASDKKSEESEKKTEAKEKTTEASEKKTESGEKKTEKTPESTTDKEKDSDESGAKVKLTAQAKYTDAFDEKEYVIEGHEDDEIKLSDKEDIDSYAKDIDGFKYTGKALIGDKSVKKIKKDKDGSVSYSSDGEDFTELKKDTKITFIYEQEFEKKKYEFENGSVKVKATLSAAEAIPDDAELKVTAVTKNSSDYNYGAYMEALNDKAGSEDKKYTEENTLLYDIAFVRDGKEIEPAKGTVSVKMVFKDNQLSGELGVKSADDLTVRHLPVKESAKKDSDDNSLSKGDIKVENVQNTSVNVKNETTAFQTESFSLYAFTVDFTYGEYTYSMPGKSEILLSEIFKALEIEEDVADVESAVFSNEELVSVEKTEENDWLLKSLKAFDTEETLTVTMASGMKYIITVTDAQNALDVSIGLYDYNDQTAIPFPENFGGTDNIYAFVWVGNSSSVKDANGNTPWAVVDISNIKGSNSPYAVSVNEFKTDQWGGNSTTPYLSLTDDEKGNLKVRVVHTTRGIGEMRLGDLMQIANGSDSQKTEYEKMWNGGFDGYNISTNHNAQLNASAGTYEVGFMKGNTLEHDVVLKFNPESDKGAIPSGKYFVLLDATSQDGNNHYYYVVEATTDGNEGVVYIRMESETWSNNQPFSDNWQSISASIITPKNGATITTGGTKPNADDYTKSYMLGDYTYSYKGRKSETDDENHIQRDEFVFELKKANFDSAIDPYDVLGEGAEYGVIADTYIRKQHTETNFAVNKYVEDTDAGIDLAANGGESEAMPYYIGEYNHLKFTSNTKVNPDIYTPSSKTETYVHNNADDEETDHIHQDGTGYDVTVIPTSKDEVSSYVSGLIDKLTSSSETYAGKTTIKADPGREIDTTSLPDNITIYVDASDLNISEPGWTIKKLNGQSIVLNIPGSNVTIAKEDVSVYTKDDDGNLTPVVEKLDSNTGGGGGNQAHNNNVENHILNHIVLNAYEATSVKFKTGPAGLFLAPNADFEEVDGSGTGWVATGKSFTQTGSEWHFFRTQRKYKAEGDFSLSGQKKIMAGEVEKDYSEFSSMEFTFELYECDENGAVAEGAEAIDTVTAGADGTFEFNKLKYNQTNVPEGTSKTFYYVIKEKAHVKANGVTYDAPPVYVKVEATDVAGSEEITFEISKGSEFGSWTAITPSDTVYDIGGFPNTYEEEKGNIEISKTVVSPIAAEATQTFTFTIELSDKTVNGEFSEVTFENGVATVEIAGGSSKKIEGLPAGVTYEVTEAEDSNFTTTSTGESGTITANETATAAFINTRKLGDLEISKTVVSPVAADKNAEYTFTVELKNGDETVSGTFGGIEFKDGKATIKITGQGTQTLTGLPVGTTYKVTEAAVTNMTTTSEGQTGEISSTKSTAAFTNTRDTGNISISKKVVSPIPAEKTKEFTFTITLSDTSITGTFSGVSFTNGVGTVTVAGGATKTIEELPAGVTYTVTEAAESNFVNTETTGNEGTIEASKTKEAAFINTRKTGDLEVSKTVTSSTASDKTKEFSFTVTLSDKTISGTFGGMTFENGVATFTLKDGQTISATGLPVGITYKVEETTADGFVITKTGEEGTISADKSEAKFTNTKSEGGLIVSKSVTSDLESDKTKDFSFKVELSDKTISGTFGGMTFDKGVANFTLKDGETCSATGLPEGVEYTVTEKDENGFTTTKTGDTGAIVEGETKTAAFVNTRDVGTLEISKTVVSPVPAEQTANYTFTIELTNGTEKVSGTFSGVTFTDGEAQITVAGGASKTIEGLPVGTTYKVTEAAVTNMTTTKEGDQGTISDKVSKAAFTNTRATGNISISKTVVSPIPAEETKSFTFNIELSDTTITGTFSGVSFKDGKAEITVAGKETKTIEGLPAGVTYTVTEATDNDFNNTEKTNDTGKIPVGKTAAAAFTNRRKTGDLEVSKTVTSSTASDKTKEFSFTVTLSDKTISGTFGGMTFENGVATFTLKDSETKSATGLPVGIGYTVVEENDGAFVTTKTGDTGKISAEVATAAFTNTKSEGGLIVSKSVTSALASDKTKDFSFTVTLSDKTISGKYGDMTFDKGIATFTLKDGATCSATGLPKGVEYTVTETKEDGFTTTKTGDTGTIVVDKTQTSTFVNTRDTGKLEISKKVVSPVPAEKTANYIFTIELTNGTEKVSGTFSGVTFTDGVAEITVAGGASKTIEGLPVGTTYKVTEAAVTNMTTTKEDEEGTISKDTSEAAFTNTRDTGKISISKTVVSPIPAEETKSFTFNIELSDTTISGEFSGVTFTNGKAEITVAGKETKTISGLPVGVRYTVTEVADTNFENTAKSGDTGEISSTESKAEFTNTRKTGDLKVSKTVTSSTASDKQKDFSFTVTLSDTTISGKFGGMIFENGVATFTLKDSETKSATGLPVGITYEVAETTADGFVITNSGATGTISATESEAKFTNTKDEGGLIVSKSVTSDLASDKTKDFSFKVELSDKTVNGKYGEMTFTNGVAEFTLKDGEAKTATGLAKDIKYTVTETDEKGFTTTNTGATGTIVKDETKTSEFVNKRDTGDLKISKKVVSPVPAEKTANYIFTIELTNGTEKVSGTFSDITFTDGVAEITVAGGESKTIKGLPVGTTYKVTEAAVTNMTTTKEGEEGTISKDTSEAAFTNTRATGKISISKTVVSPIPAEETKSFTFNIKLSDETISGEFSGVTFTDGKAEITVAGKETKTIEGLPAGVNYTVTEATDNDFENTEKSGDTGLIPSGDTAAAAFTNTRKTGDLEISKTVVSDRTADADQTFKFTIVLSEKTITGTFGDLKFTDGKAEIELKGGESKSATGLPVGITYKVTEAEADGFIVKAEKAEGKISEEAAKATFTNTRETGDLKISKKLVSDKTADKDQEFTFTITLNDDGINGTYGDMSFTDGVATVKLKGGETATAKDLPTDIDYTVTEVEVEGFVVEMTKGSGTITTEGCSETFTNTRETGDLKVSKSVKSSTGADKKKKFSFKVVLDDTGINGTYGDMTFKNGVAEFKLADGETAKAEGLPTTVAYTVIEEDADQNNFVTTSTGTEGSIQKDKAGDAAFVNTKLEGGLAVKKSVTSDLAKDKDQEFKFKVTLDDTSVSGTYGDMTFKNGVASFTLADGESCIAEGLGKGIGYKVEEETSKNFTKTSTGETGTIVEKKASIASFVNTRKTGDLTVSKKVISDKSSDKNRSFTFTVTLSDTSISGDFGDMEFSKGKATFTLSDGESATAEDLPIGVTYTVTEAKAKGFKLKGKTGEKGTITTSESKAKFTNKRADSKKGGGSKTGDNNPIMQWLMIMLLALAGIGGAGYALKKNKKEEE